MAKTKRVEKRPVEYSAPGHEKIPVEQCITYAQAIADALYKKHWKKHGSDWRTFDDLWGVLEQIDNMTAGMIKDPRWNVPTRHHEILNRRLRAKKTTDS